MRADFRVCLDACVLANQGVCDLLLRLAEHPRLYSPVFSEKILDEVYSVHLEKLKRPWPKDLAGYWQEQVRESFEEAIVSNYDSLIPILKNHEDDRHVLAAAIRGQAQLIVTFTLKDFRAEHLEEWDIQAIHPQDYLITLFEMSPEVVVDRLHLIGRDRGINPPEVLTHLTKSLPLFAESVARELGWAI